MFKQNQLQDWSFKWQWMGSRWEGQGECVCASSKLL